MKSITEMTGGEFFLVQSGQNLQQVYDTIDKLEKGKVGSTATVKEQTSLQRISFYPFFIALGMLSFLGSLLLDTTFLRKVP
jgi:Ca-activated chloride channel family protein